MSGRRLTLGCADPHSSTDWPEHTECDPSLTPAWRRQSYQPRKAGRNERSIGHRFINRQVGDFSHRAWLEHPKNTSRYTPIANHVHAVEAVVAYCGLVKEVELIPTSPFQVEDGRPGFNSLAASNPLLSVPCLQTSDGQILCGGPVIYEYLDAQRKGGVPALFPEATGSDAAICVRQALWIADGIFDQFVRIVLETRGEAKETPRPKFAERQWLKVTNCFDALDREAALWKENAAPLDIAQLRAACSMDFLNRRIPSDATRVAGVPDDFDWRKGRDSLSS